ncbi:peptide chain release factor N(5)-glutamine methyltransferase [soil metagenome]
MMAYLSAEMTIKEQYQLLSQQLQKLYSLTEAETITSWVLEHYTGLSRMAIKTNAEKKLSIHEKQLIGGALTELLLYRPVQYVLGEAWFKNMAFYVDESVLIPRPETEEIVNWVVETLLNAKADKTILEIGTGSGCIAIAIKKANTQTNVTAVDISSSALMVAKINAEKLKCSIHLLKLDFLAEVHWHSLPKYDVIVSNPPYIPINEKEKLDKNVTDWEPATALFVPDNDTLLFYRKIAAFGKSHLEKDGMIFVECHQDFAKATLELFTTAGYLTTLKKDMFDNDRMVKAILV